MRAFILYKQLIIFISYLKKDLLNLLFIKQKNNIELIFDSISTKNFKDFF